MSMEWKKCRLESISESIQTGPFGSQLHQSDYSEMGTPVIMPKDMVNGTLVESSIARISYDHVQRLKRHQVKAGDIIYSRRGDVGRCVLITKGQEDWICGTGCLKVSLKKNEVIPSFIIYILQRKDSVGWVENHAVGATMPNLNTGILSKLPLLLPSLPIQQKISSILSAYDSLIENNTKRIKLLEQMAENLYKEWFVRFRFPGHENVEMKKTKLGKLPCSFSITNMNSVIDYYIGGGWGNDEYSNDFPIQASVIRGADFPSVTKYDTSTCPNRFHKESNYKSRQLQDGDIVMEISGGTSEQPVGRTVLVTQDLIDRFEDGKLICASFCKLIRLKKDVISPYYFYYWMQYLYDTRIIDRFQLQSTGIINFKFEPFLKKGDVMLPPMDLMQIFDKHIIPLFQEINSLAKQNTLLAHQRNLLLPRLMSGKLEVKP